MTRVLAWAMARLFALRCWAIRKLAGRSLVVLNARVRATPNGAVSPTHHGSPALIDGCDFEPDPAAAGFSICIDLRPPA